jgi:glycerol-3-phosphate dehydrogenase
MVLIDQTLPEGRTGRNQASVPAVDIAVIGGGVVGCATARKFALLGASVVLLESSTDILAGASKGNSALLHTGFDAPPGSLELRLMRRGYREYLSIREKLNLPLLETGAMVVAWSEAELARLDGILRQAIENGVQDVSLLDSADVLRREPSLSPSLRGALLVPGEHVIDSWSAPLAYLTQALAHGAEVWLRAEVVNGEFTGQSWLLKTARGPLRANYVVNCAGLYGDVVEQRCLGDKSFDIRPRKGQFVVFDKPAAKLISSIILPVPTDLTKGVVIARTIYGNVLVGPTAEEQPDRARATVDHDVLEGLIARAVRMIPALQQIPVNATYAGLRPASDKKEYRIRTDQDRHWITLGGIRSTGLTASLGLASYAAELLGDAPWSGTLAMNPVWTPVPNLAEHLPRDWQTPGYGEIVCHCEMVTRREIDNAFASPLPPGNFGGLRRRTRAAMGRCQGFYCGAQLAELTQSRLSPPLATTMADD